MSLITKEFVDQEDVKVAIALYNDIRTTLEENGWPCRQKPEYNGDSPGYWWRHPAHKGTFSMSAAHGQWRLDIECRKWAESQPDCAANLRNWMAR